jgi:hypothetical protein
MYENWLGVAADWSAILTAGVATVAYARFVSAQRKRRNALEQYLRDEKLNGVDGARRTIMHLMANLSMSEAEVLQAGFQSDLVRAVPGVDEEGRAVRLYFEYAGTDVPVPKKF